MKQQVDYRRRRGTTRLLLALCAWIGLWAVPVSAGEGGNILVNGDFSNGTQSWSFYTNGSGAFSVDNGVASVEIFVEGTNVQLMQTGVVLEPNTEYEVRLRARNTGGDNIKLRLHRHSPSHDNYGLDVIFDLTNEMQDFSTVFTSISGDVTDGRFAFWLASYDQPGNHYFIESVVVAPAGAGDVTAPSVPTGLAPVPLSSTEIQLDWQPSADDTGVTSYRVYRDGQQIAETGDTSYLDSGLTPDTQYTYAISAADAAGNVSPLSSGASATTAQADLQPPTVPELVFASARSSRSVQVVWSPSFDASGVSFYRVLRNRATIAETPSRVYLDTGLQASTRYSYSIVAIDGEGNTSAPSVPVSVNTPPDFRPTPPQAVNAVATSPIAIRVSWIPATDDNGIAGYRVFRGRQMVAELPETVFIDTGLEPERTYTYRVFAIDDMGQMSIAGGPSSATTLELDLTPPSIPTGLAASAISPTEVQVDWNASTDASGVASYQLFRGGSLIYDGNVTTFVDQGLDPLSTYFYTVRAVDIFENESGVSPPVSAMTPTDDDDPPTVPQNFAAEALSHTSIAISWSPSTDQTGVDDYRLFRDGLIIYEGLSTNYVDENLSPATTYEYYVIAVDTLGFISDPSTTAVVSTLGLLQPPSGLAAEGLSATQIDLRWLPVDAETPIMEYLLQRDDGYEVRTPLLYHSDHGLDDERQYSYRVKSVDTQGNQSDWSSWVSASTNSDYSATVFDLFYGTVQSFGTPGLSQNWVNIVGNIDDPSGEAGLDFSLNGGFYSPAGLGSNGNRLEFGGDFNIDLDPNSLRDGVNELRLRARDGGGRETTKTVTVLFERGNVWPTNFSIDWGSVSQLSDVIDVVDGRWSWDSNGIHNDLPGYDRLFAFGDVTWTDYELVVPFTVHSQVDGTASGVGIIMRWTGHTDSPVVCSQPKCGWEPNGNSVWYRWFDFGGAPDSFGGTLEDPDYNTLETGVTYMIRARVQGNDYRYRIWIAGQSEHSSWTAIGAGDPSVTAGSVLMIAHNMEVTFGDIQVFPVSSVEAEQEDTQQTAVDAEAAAEPR